MELRRFNNSMVEGERIIHTASPFARQNLIYLQEIGKSKYLTAYKSKRESLPSFLFCIVKKGSGQLEYHDTVYSIGTNECVFINCNQEYTISSETDLWELDWVHFNGSSMQAIYDKFIERCGGPCFKATNLNTLDEQYEVIFETANSESYVQDMALMSQLSLLMTMIMEQCWKKTNEGKSKAFERKWILVKDYIDENYKVQINLDDLSQKFFINKYYLERKFKEEYGCTIIQYVTNLRVTASKELLRFSDCNITEIAFRLGFSDCAYFTRAFKKEVGISPLQFRKQWKYKVID